MNALCEEQYFAVWNDSVLGEELFSQEELNRRNDHLDISDVLFRLADKLGLSVPNEMNEYIKLKK